MCARLLSSFWEQCSYIARIRQEISCEDRQIETLISKLPKAELHLHIEGTFEPELIFEIAQRNKLKFPYASVEDLRKAYQFEDLQSFLNLYYAGMDVLRTAQDYVDLANAYFNRAQKQNVVHAELFFDPQAHTSRGVSFDAVMEGLWESVSNSKKRYGITSKLIMCFLRDESSDSAMRTLEQALRHKDKIVGVGLDSAEKGHPPTKFKDVFDRARAEGFLTVCHAGEEGPPEYVWEALDVLKVSRVDHGVRSLEDPRLVDRLIEDQVPLTVCPMSNIKLRVFDKMDDHNLKKMIDLGIRATVNSDDPAYFGGYVSENFVSASEALGLTHDDLVRLAENSFRASFLTDQERAEYLDMVANAVNGKACAVE